MKQQATLVGVVVVVIALMGILAWGWLASNPEAAALDSTRTPTGARRVDRDVSAMPADLALANPPEERNVLAPLAATNERSMIATSTVAEPQLEVQVVRASDKTPVVGATILFVGSPDTLDWPDATAAFRAGFRAGELEPMLAGQSEPPPVRTVTDDEGRARIPRPERGGVIVAAAEGLWSYHVLVQEMRSPLVLELHPRAALDVEVVDERGQPVGGVLVALRTRAGDAHLDRIVVPTGANGRATLEHAGFVLGTSRGPQSGEWKVALGAVLAEPVEVAVDLSNLPTAPVRLVLPATGTCIVRIEDTQEQLHLGEVYVGLRLLDLTEGLDTDIGARVSSPSFMFPEVRGGVARFEHVQAGRDLEVEFRRAGSGVYNRVRGPGPAVANSEAVLVVTLGGDYPVLAGRALDENGGVLAEARLRARVHRPDWTGDVQDTWDLRTDAEGRFQVDAEPDEKSSLQLTVYTFDASGAEQESATRDLPPGPPHGLHELGDFTLKPSPLLASGTVVDDAGEPVPGAMVRAAVKQFWGSGEDSFWWRDLYGAECKSNAEGKFELRARVATAEIRLTASTSEHAGQPAFVAPGSSDLLLTLSSTGRIAGRVLLDPGVPRELLTVAAVRDNSGEPGRSNARVSFARLDAEGNFELPKLRPGNYRVSLECGEEGWPPLASVASVRVAAGSVVRDPQLDPLDLRGKLRPLTLDIVDLDAQPIVKGEVHWSTATKSSMRRFENGRCIVLYEQGPLDVVVVAWGYRTVRLEDISTDQRVVLQAGAEVQLRLAPGLRTPEPPYFLGVRLLPKAEGFKGRMYGGGLESDFDASGELVTLAPAVGPVEVQFSLSLRRASGWMQTYFSAGAPQVLEIADVPGRQSFEVRFDPEVLEQTRAGLGGD